MSLTPVMRAALHYIETHGASIEMGSSPYSLGTIKALERRGFVQSHTSMHYMGIGHFLTPEGREVARRIARENLASFKRTAIGRNP